MALNLLCGGGREMYKLLNGRLVELTSTELAELEAEHHREEIAERTRPLTEAEIINIIIRSQINSVHVNDQMALRMISYYPEWEAGINLPKEQNGNPYKIQYKGELYKVKIAHTTQSDWTPDISPTLFERIDEDHEGTIDDPKQYKGNMELIKGLYYFQDNEIYYCKYGSGIPVYAHLSELTTFVEKVQ